MQKLKNLIFVLVFFLGCMGLAKADLAGYEIENYQADFELTSGGILKTKEQIQVNFTEPRHGIYRDIPFKYPKSDYLLETPISDVVVLGYDFRSFENGNDYRIKIGSPDFKVNGNQNYTIFYDVRGAVREFTGYQELYWNMLGTNWNTKIKNFNFSVTLPSDVALEPETEYYAVWGEKGSKDRIKLEKNGNKIQNAESLSLAPYQAVTIAVKLPEKYVPAEEFREEIPVYQSQSISYQEAEEKITSKENGGTRKEDWKENVIVYALLMIPILMVLVLLYFPLKYIFGMLYRLFFVLFIRKKQEIRDVIYYAPPKMAVGEMTLLFYNAPVLNAVFATLYDWRVKGLIAIDANSEQVRITKKREKPDSFSLFESELWIKIKLDQNDIFIFDNKTQNCSWGDWNQLIGEVMNKKTQERYTQRSLKYRELPALSYKQDMRFSWPRFEFDWVSFILFMIFIFPVLVRLFIAAFAIAYGFFVGDDNLFRIVVLSIVLLVNRSRIASFFNNCVLEYTSSAAGDYEVMRGYKKYLKKVEEAKLKFLLKHDPNYFEKTLPYAIAFGIETEWIEKCKKIFEGLNYHSSLVVVEQFSSGLVFLQKDSSFNPPYEPDDSSSSDSSDFGSDSGFDSDGGSSGGGGGGGGGGSR